MVVMKMPGFDGTGPLGQGPFTGGGKGFCVMPLNSNVLKEVTKMPRGDGTGPAGMGPMTGRAAGYCAGYAVPGYANPLGGRFPGAGRFFAGGRGGRGYRNWYRATGLTGWQRYNAGMPAWGGVYAPPVNPVVDPNFVQAVTPDQEKEMLKEQAEFLKQQMDDIQLRLDELEKTTVKKEKKS